MKYELKKLNLDMGKKEYEMYQDIPAKENGSTNLCYGLSFDVFKNFLESQMAREYQKVSLYDTPVIIYIMYVDDIPVGYISFRTKINDNWKKWCGNIYYAIRLSMRNKGYGTKMLELVLDEARNLKYKEVYLKASDGNIASKKVIENNGGILIKEDDGLFYKILLKN